MTPGARELLIWLGKDLGRHLRDGFKTTHSVVTAHNPDGSIPVYAGSGRRWKKDREDQRDELIVLRLIYKCQDKWKLTNKGIESVRGESLHKIPGDRGCKRRGCKAWAVRGEALCYYHGHQDKGSFTPSPESKPKAKPRRGGAKGKSGGNPKSVLAQHDRAHRELLEERRALRRPPKPKTCSHHPEGPRACPGCEELWRIGERAWKTVERAREVANG